MSRPLIRNGRVVLKNGRPVIGQCPRCCNGSGPTPCQTCECWPLYGRCGTSDRVEEWCRCRGSNYRFKFDGEWNYHHEGRGHIWITFPDGRESHFYALGEVCSFTISAHYRVSYTCDPEHPSIQHADYSGSTLTVTRSGRARGAVLGCDPYSETLRWEGEEAFWVLAGNLGISHACEQIYPINMNEAAFRFGCFWAEDRQWNIEWDYALQGTPCSGESTWGTGAHAGRRQDPIVTVDWGCLHHEGNTNAWPWGMDIYTDRRASWRYQQTCQQGSASENIVTETNYYFGGTAGGAQEPPTSHSGGSLRANARYSSTVSWEYDRDPCVVDPCDTPTRTGACCPTIGLGVFGSGCVMTTPANCAQRQGIYQGDGVLCQDANCPPRGGCCLPDGRCIQTTKALCEAGLNGLGGTYLGDDYLCTGWDCPGPVGGCCIAGICYSLTLRECDRRSGRWLGQDNPCPYEGMPCDPLPPAPGACCIPNSGCLENVSEATCAQKGGKFLGYNSACVTNGIPNCPNVGACCIIEPISGQPLCIYADQANCERQGGRFRGVRTGCGPGTCDRPNTTPINPNPSGAEGMA